MGRFLRWLLGSRKPAEIELHQSQLRERMVRPASIPRSRAQRELRGLLNSEGRKS